MENGYSIRNSSVKNGYSIQNSSVENGYSVYFGNFTTAAFNLFSFKNKTIFQIKMDNLGYVDSESEEDDSSEDNQFNAEDIPDMERLFLNPYR